MILSSKTFLVPIVTLSTQDNANYSYSHPYFKKHYKLIAIDLSKQEALDADSKAIQTTIFNFILLFTRDGDTITSFTLEEVKETI